MYYQVFIQNINQWHSYLDSWLYENNYQYPSTWSFFRWRPSLESWCCSQPGGNSIGPWITHRFYPPVWCRSDFCRTLSKMDNWSISQSYYKKKGKSNNACIIWIKARESFKLHGDWVTLFQKFVLDCLVIRTRSWFLHCKNSKQECNKISQTAWDRTVADIR